MTRVLVHIPQKENAITCKSTSVWNIYHHDRCSFIVEREKRTWKIVTRICDLTRKVIWFSNVYWNNYNKGALMYTFLATHTFERKKRNAITRYRSCSPKRDTQRCHAVLDKREKRPLKIVTICHITILQKGVGIQRGNIWYIKNRLKSASYANWPDTSNLR